MQLRFQTELPFEQYVKAEGWQDASLTRCPLCGQGHCRLHRHGTYVRLYPSVSKVRRYRCTTTGGTISLLPDFFCSRMRGTLAEFERVAADAQAAKSVEAAANVERPADVEDAVTLATAVRWVSLRVRRVKALLVTICTLLPDRFAGCAPIVHIFRQHLQTDCALVVLREICATQLHGLAAPLGLVGPSKGMNQRGKARQQLTGLDPPRVLP